MMTPLISLIGNWNKGKNWFYACITGTAYYKKSAKIIIGAPYVDTWTANLEVRTVNRDINSKKFWVKTPNLHGNIEASLLLIWPKKILTIFGTQFLHCDINN